jgi:peptidoglycan hydrolase CwlO-like protein
MPGFAGPDHARLGRRLRRGRGKDTFDRAKITRYRFAGDIAMALDTDRIDDTVLALLYLTLHDQYRAWKGFDWDTLSRLHEKGMIENPVGKAKSVEFTTDGLRRSKEMFEAMFTRRFTEQLSQQASVDELEDVVDALRLLEANKENSTEAFNQYMALTGRIKQIVERPEVAAIFAHTESAKLEQISKYPNIRVELADLGNQLWPILRRVSYAMSDAGVKDAEIEQYKNEMKSSDDPVAVSRRWVQLV